MSALSFISFEIKHVWELTEFLANTHSKMWQFIQYNGEARLASGIGFQLNRLQAWDLTKILEYEKKDDSRIVDVLLLAKEENYAE